MFLTTLKIVIPEELKNMYEIAINNNNKDIDSNPYPNSGFDLFVPDDITVLPGEVKFISHEVKCEMKDRSGYYLYPRSSISKTPLMMANHVGIIDSGYRGNIIAAVRNVSKAPYIIDRGTRLFQICHATLKPFYIQSVSELSDTRRGEGGFGSTNIPLLSFEVNESTESISALGDGI
tara:strand:- start:2565 stop:3095 length:531 start_codon:yes stop_codon:yes gene_type:complete